MRTTTTATSNAWESGGYVAGNQVNMRATIQVLNVYIGQYSLAGVQYSTRTGIGNVSSIPFNQHITPVELPNIKSIEWDRSTEQDVATCTIEMFNVRELPPGTAAPNAEDFDQPGFYTFNRGRSPVGNARWGYTANGQWSDLIVPDRLIRTFEGYGANYAVPPEQDVNMYPSGLWLIDDVDLTPNGILTLTCRDIGRALIDQIHLPPVVPLTQYPVSWTRLETVDDESVHSSSTGWHRPNYDKDSNLPYIGAGITDNGVPYVSSNGGVQGHDGRDAFDSSSADASYWLSVGNRQKWSSAYEYVQGKFSSRDIAAVRVKPWAGPYKMYVSVYAGGEWKGKRKIPYRARVVDTSADIKYVKVITIKKGINTVIRLPRTYANATKVRITCSNLYDSGIGANFPYRAGIRDVEVSGTVDTTTSGTHIEGDYNDYTEIVKWLCAWGGWYWPRGPANAFFRYTDATNHNFLGVYDPIFPNSVTNGGVWGNFEQTTKNGPATLTVDLFDKKPLMDGILYVKDMVGYNFYIDECGGVVWRAPNIWSVGNNRFPIHGGPITQARTTAMITIDEEQTLMDLSVKVSSRNVREQVFVSNATGEVGAVSAGYNPYPSGLRRVGGWTDQHFGDEAANANAARDECQIMADLITVRQMFSYRSNSVTIPGNPAIQIDDQVRIYERVTGETYIHYVSGINSKWDVQTGQWTYTLTTHWLGETPFTDWSFDPNTLSEATKLYLTATGKM